MTEPTCQPFTWPTDADGWPLDLCTECGTPVSGAARHYRCGAALMANGLTEGETAATASVAGLTSAVERVAARLDTDPEFAKSLLPNMTHAEVKAALQKRPT